MKKIIAIVLTLVLCASVLSVTALADGQAALGMDTGLTAERGETVTMNVYLGNNPGIGAMNFGYTYDSSILELVSVSGVGMMGQGVWTINDYILWDGAADSTFNGTILTFTFKVKSDAAIGSVANVSIYCRSAWSFETDEEVKISGSGGTVEVVCNHNWGEGVVTKEHSCTEDGEKTYTCSVCGSTKTEVIPAAHTFNETVWEYDEFSHWHKCSVCGAKCTHEDDHTLYDVVVKDAQPGVTGLKYQKCEICAYKSEDMVIPALPEDIDPVPGTGDITPQLTVAFNAVLITLIAAVAFVFKRKAAK